MPQNFIDCDREQAFLLPPSLRDWLPADHLAWFVIESVERLDLEAFYAAYRPDGHGRAAYEPSMMVGLVLYAYSTNVRSSREIERHCRQDIAYRVITGNRVPDHATVARFIVRHEQRLAELFTSVLRLCAKAGLVRSGVVAVDGTKLSASANSDSNVDYDRIAREIIAEAIATDAVEDEQHGNARGDELPPELSTEAARREWLTRALEEEQRAEGEVDEGPPVEDQDVDPLDGFDAERILARVQGRAGWLREAHRQLEQERWETAGPLPQSRSERLRIAARQFEENLAAELRGSNAYDASREQRRGTRRIGGPPKPYTPPEIPQGEVNVTDPDSRRMKGNRRYIQGYNAQAVVNEQQIVLAAEISTAAGDFSQLRPMIEATLGEIEHAGAGRPTVALADAQYWNEQHMDDVTAGHGIQVLIPPDSGKRKGERPGWTGGRYAFMRRVLATDLGKELYRKRQQSIEPVFGHTKHNRRFDRFHRRGRLAVRTEWRLITMSHNLTKLHRHQLATVRA
jgi:transposase